MIVTGSYQWNDGRYLLSLIKRRYKKLPHYCPGSAIFLQTLSDQRIVLAKEDRQRVFIYTQILSLEVWKCSILRDWKGRSERGTHGGRHNYFSLSSAISGDLLKYQKYIRVQHHRMRKRELYYLDLFFFSSSNAVSSDIWNSTKKGKKIK